MTDRASSDYGTLFRIFLRLGLTSFGGPVAHLGYFRTEFVERLKWLDDKAYADLVALCQVLPGPASSQVNFGIGLLRGGWLGGLIAWAGFTLPSALALVLLALGLDLLDGAAASGWIHGLKLAAVVVVAHAVWGMGKSLAPDAPRFSLAVLSAATMLLVGGAWMQVGVIAVGALVGLLFLTSEDKAGETSLHPGIGKGFGGGHVVLPLLQAEVVPPGWVAQDQFLAGYGAAQAVPGPLFTFAAYLGAVIDGWGGAALALAAIYVPSILLVVGALPFWETLRHHPKIRAGLNGVNAAVVGLLLAAFYDPVFTSAVTGGPDAALALAAFALLTVWKIPPWAVVMVAAACGWGLEGLSAA